MDLSYIGTPEPGARLPLYLRVGDRGSAHWRRVGELVPGVDGGPEFRPAYAGLRAVWDAGLKRRPPTSEAVAFGVGPIERGVRVIGYVAVAPWMARPLREPGPPKPDAGPRDRTPTETFDSLTPSPTAVVRAPPSPAQRGPTRRRLAWSSGDDPPFRLLPVASPPHRGDTRSGQGRTRPMWRGTLKARG